MAKKKTEKIEKIEVINENFDFSNVSTIGRNVSNKIEVNSQDNSSDKLVRFKLFLSNDYFDKYDNLYYQYVSGNQIFNLTNLKFFNICVLFLKSVFESEKMYVECPQDFHKHVVRPGKRKRNDRYVSNEDSHSVGYIVDEKVSDIYSSLMYSYILKYDKKSLFDQKHSRGYFFYDFINLLVKYDKKLIKFSL